MNLDHLDYHIVATTLDTGGVRLRIGWHVVVFLQNLLKWQDEFYARLKMEPKNFGPEVRRSFKFRRFVEKTANSPPEMW